MSKLPPPPFVNKNNWQRKFPKKPVEKAKPANIVEALEQLEEEKAEALPEVAEPEPAEEEIIIEEIVEEVFAKKEEEATSEDSDEEEILIEEIVDPTE